jgi:hypothetical protein
VVVDDEQPQRTHGIGLAHGSPSLAVGAGSVTMIRVPEPG